MNKVDFEVQLFKAVVTPCVRGKPVQHQILFPTVAENKCVFSFNFYASHCISLVTSLLCQN